MILVIFDIDGTLLDTSGVDDECLVKAMEMVFGINVTNCNWDEYPNATDSGVMNEIVRRKLGRSPDDSETRLFIDAFVGLLDDYHQEDPEMFREINGATQMLDHLLARNDCRTALATGGWKASAKLKLFRAGLPVDGIPMATADDSTVREQIVQKSIVRARTQYGVDNFTRIISVGDGPWDVKAARHLKLPFIGVGSDHSLGPLGAEYLIEDFSDLNVFLELLEAAEPPKE